MKCWIWRGLVSLLIGAVNEADEHVMVPRVFAARFAALLIASFVIGGLIGAVSGELMMPGGGAPGSAMGILLGAALSPMFAWSLVRKSAPAHISVALVALPSMLVGGVAGSAGNALVAFVLSGVVFAAMCWVVRLSLQDAPEFSQPHLCRACDYDCTGLAQCPECGTQVGRVSPARFVPRARNARVVVFLTIILGVLGPLGLAVMLAVERHRPRTTAELIEQLSDNDIQIQWEARHALSQLGSKPLIAALRHPRAAVRANAARALAEVRDSAARTALTQALSDSDPNVRANAQQALDALGPAGPP